MAATDYTQTGDSPACPVGTLLTAITPLQAEFALDDFYEVAGFSAGDLVVGMAVLIDDEVCRLDDFAFPFITVSRGCADTVPAAHAPGAVVWFFSENAGSDNIEYLAGETIAVKASPYTTTGETVPVEYTPALEVTFNSRFARPYPPADFKCQGSSWSEGVKFASAEDTGFLFTWAHRDRLLQRDQLLGHTEASIGPEVGTTYSAEVYNGSNALVNTFLGITGTSWEYPIADALADLPGLLGYVIFYSERDGLESLQSYRTDIEIQVQADRVTEDLEDERITEDGNNNRIEE